MDFRIIQIYNSKRLIDYPYNITGYSSDQVTEEFIEEITSDPSVYTIGIFDLLPNKTFKMLERVYSKRPDIEFRVSGWNPQDDFRGWDLRFLTQMPSIRKLSIDGFPCFDTDLTILKNMSNLKELRWISSYWHGTNSRPYLEYTPDLLPLLTNNTGSFSSK